MPARLTYFMAGKALIWVLPALVVNCAASTPKAEPPPFLGEETEFWLVQETGPVGRDDILPAFEAAARNYGCGTEHIGGGASHNIHGEIRSHFGVSASCDEGTIAIITLVGGGVRIGCAKPTTREACDQLIRNISQPR